MFKFRFRTKVQCCKSAFRRYKSKEEQEYVDAIKEDLVWLGFNWTEEDILLITFNNCMIGLLDD
jgi:hypothetical protein